jgi:hypothetical protein
MILTNHEAAQVCEALHDWKAHSRPWVSAKEVASFDALLAKVMKQYGIGQCVICEDFAPNRGNWDRTALGDRCPRCVDRQAREANP